MSDFDTVHINLTRADGWIMKRGWSARILCGGILYSNPNVICGEFTLSRAVEIQMGFDTPSTTEDE